MSVLHKLVEELNEGKLSNIAHAGHRRGPHTHEGFHIHLTSKPHARILGTK